MKNAPVSTLWFFIQCGFNPFLSASSEKNESPEFIETAAEHFIIVLYIFF